jgi:hypothetical protein
LAQQREKLRQTVRTFMSQAHLAGLEFTDLVDLLNEAAVEIAHEQEKK